MASRRPPGGLLQGPIAFWSLVLLLILAVYGGFRALAPRHSRPQSSASIAAGSPAAPAGSSAAGAPLWGGKPLQLKKPLAPMLPVAGSAPVVAGAPAAAPQGVGLTPEEVAARIRQGHPALVLFFATESLGAREMFPQLVKLTQSADVPGVLAFATDQDASAVDTFLRVNGASFEAPLVRPSKPGELGTALAELGLKIGKQLDTPFVALVGAEGEIRGQWSGITDLAPVVKALNTMKKEKEEKEGEEKAEKEEQDVGG